LSHPNLAVIGRLLALAVVAVALWIALVGGGSTYVVHAEFSDAGQLVAGDLVTISGHEVGTVGSISLTGNGLASIELDISDNSVTPLTSGTIARIGQLSLTGVANRFVALTPRPGRPIPSGGTLPATQTSGIVDLDIVLDSLTPRVRSSLQNIISTGAYVFSGKTPAQANQTFRYLDPAFSQAAALSREIVSDKFALQRLVSSSAAVSSALAARTSDLGGAVSNTAVVLGQLAAERSAVSDSLARAPGVLTQSTGVLRDARTALGTLNPALSDLTPVALRITKLLDKVTPVARDAGPTITGVSKLVPSAEKALKQLPAVERKATPSVNSLAKALPPITPILSGFRPYIPDVVAGFFNPFGGTDGQGYDANGHYIRIAPLFTGTNTGLAGILNVLGNVVGSLSPLTGQRTGLLRRCPGGATTAATAGGNPWTTPDVLASAGTLCNPADDQR